MKHSAPILIALTLFIYSCKEDPAPTAPACVAGMGGDLTIVAKPQHHGRPIVSSATYPDSVFVKFNSAELPADKSSYDLIMAAEEGEDHVHIEGLKCGNYFIYMTGFDTLINQRVSGGLPFSTTQTSGELELIVPVTE